MTPIASATSLYCSLCRYDKRRKAVFSMLLEASVQDHFVPPVTQSHQSRECVTQEAAHLMVTRKQGTGFQ